MCGGLPTDMSQIPQLIEKETTVLLATVVHQAGIFQLPQALEFFVLVSDKLLAAEIFFNFVKYLYESGLYGRYVGLIELFELFVTVEDVIHDRLSDLFDLLRIFIKNLLDPERVCYRLEFMHRQRPD